jgi:hypothetical protein
MSSKRFLFFNPVSVSLPPYMLHVLSILSFTIWSCWYHYMNINIYTSSVNYTIMKYETQCCARQHRAHVSVQSE